MKRPLNQIQAQPRFAIALLGPPGSGKTTIAKSVASKDEIATVATGPLLKKLAHDDSELGRETKKHLDAGELVPTGIVTTVIADHLLEVNERHVIVDGFPRLTQQIPPFFDLLWNRDFLLRSVVILELDEEAILGRLTNRRICEKCGAVYNLKSQPPRRPDRCDQCDGELIRRNDDAPDVVRQRMERFESETKPVFDQFRAEYPELTCSINADESNETIVARITRQFSEPMPDIAEAPTEE